MCQFFSCLVTRDHRVLFCEDDSHEELIKRAGFDDTKDVFLRSWVRVEVKPAGAGWGLLEVDETSVPSWWDKVEDTDRVLTVADVVRSAWEAYEAAVRSAQEVYDAAVQPAWEAYDAAAVQPAGEAWDAAVRSARRAYEAAVRSARKDYEADVQPAWEVYTTSISAFVGYLSKKG